MLHPCRNWLTLALAISITWLVGCGDKSQRPSSDEIAAHMKGIQDPGPSDLYETEGLSIQPFDLNNDHTADLWKIFSTEKEKIDDLEATTQLVRKEVDTNFDEKVDLWFHYNQQEKLFREEADANFDGQIDLVSYYEDGRLVKRETIPPGANAPETTKHYREGRLFKIEVDEDANGFVERWEIYNDGRLIQIGHDSTADGKVDYWENLD